LSKLSGKFRRVAEDRLERLSQGLLGLEGADEAERGHHMRELLRELHTLKGESGVLGLSELSSLAHAEEHVLGKVQAGTAALAAELVDMLLAGLDAMGALVQGLELPPETLQQLREQLLGFGDDGAQAPTEARSPDKETIAQPAAERAGRAHVLRIDPARIAGLSELTADLLVYSERASQRSKRLASLVHGLRKDIEDAPWLHELTTLSRALSEDTVLDRRRIRELGAQLRQLRLSPIRDLLEGYRRPARDLARTLAKSVRVIVSAQAVEIDQSVLEVLSEPLLHLVRNAVAHGLEAPEARKAAGKDPVGTLELTVRQVGASVEITVADDGRGISPAAIARQAAERGLIPEQDAGELGMARALDLIFKPGFSTATVSEASGRGIGLDVVRRRVEESSGSLQIESQPGQGTQFVIRVPMNVTLSRALICAVGGSHYAFAVEDVQHLFPYDPAQAQPLGSRPGLLVDGATLPVRYLRSLVEAVPAGEIPPGAPVVLVRAGGRSIAVVPDAVLGQREVAYRPLGAFLSKLQVVRSSCVLADGSVALLLDPLELVSGAEAGFGRVRMDQAPRERRLVLVVEDSVITRDLIAEIVRTAGHRVSVAGDGQEALDKIARQRPDLILTDLEMPRVDGLELTRRVRAQSDWGHVPIVVITTRSSPEERRACLQAGADGFLAKSDFREAVLLETIRSLVG
jgi:two-component system chemotaxis sensor kinase CheA